MANLRLCPAYQGKLIFLSSNHVRNEVLRDRSLQSVELEIFTDRQNQDSELDSSGCAPSQTRGVHAQSATSKVSAPATGALVDEHAAFHALFAWVQNVVVVVESFAGLFVAPQSNSRGRI